MIKAFSHVKAASVCQRTLSFIEIPAQCSLEGTYREQEVEGEEEILDDFHGALHLDRCTDPHCRPSATRLKKTDVAAVT